MFEELANKVFPDIKQSQVYKKYLATTQISF